MRNPVRHLPFLAVAITVVLCCASTADATPISVYSGSFAQDDDRFEVSFTLTSATLVSMQTWSYAGGTDPNGDAVLGGGFAPVLSLFDPFDVLLAYDAGAPAPSGCGPRGVDAVTGFCLDAFLSATLAPGPYRLVLTQYDNLPFGPAYGDGFLRDGQGDFTGPAILGLPGSFIDPAGDQRTSAYFLSISVPAAEPVPEPATLLTLASGVILCAARRRRALQARSHSAESDK